MIRIREIEPGDNKSLAAIIRSVFHEFDMPRTGTVYADPATDALYELFRVQRSVYWVADDEGRVLGGCGIFPTRGLPQGCAELVKFYLLPAARGKGLGRELMDKSIASARAMGYSQVYLESFPALEKAVVLYQKAGFRMLDSPMGESGHSSCTMWMLLSII